MISWKDLRAEFEALGPGLRDARLDYQGGAAGEYRTIAGGADLIARKKFESISRLAGKRVVDVPAEMLHSEVSADTNPLSGWYHTLRCHSQLYEPDPPAYQIEEDGSRGLLYGGSIRRPAEVSAMLCLQFMQEEAHRQALRIHTVADTAGNAAEAGSDTWSGQLNRWLQARPAAADMFGWWSDPPRGRTQQAVICAGGKMIACS
jgi:hypothetical protein